MISAQVPSSTLAVEMIEQWADANGLVLQRGQSSGGAVLSPCLRYRYLLWRYAIGSWPFMAFGMLNPSTADANADDRTIARCNSFRPQGFSGPLVWNLFAYRATDPADMRQAADPVGPLNDSAIDLALRISGMTIAAWGAHGGYLSRDRQVLRRCGAVSAKLQALKLTDKGHPGHPLYLPRQTRPFDWEYEW